MPVKSVFYSLIILVTASVGSNAQMDVANTQVTSHARVTKSIFDDEPIDAKVQGDESSAKNSIQSDDQLSRLEKIDQLPSQEKEIKAMQAQLKDLQTAGNKEAQLDIAGAMTQNSQSSSARKGPVMLNGNQNSTEVIGGQVRNTLPVGLLMTFKLTCGCYARLENAGNHMHVVHKKQFFLVRRIQGQANHLAIPVGDLPDDSVLYWLPESKAYAAYAKQ